MSELYLRIGQVRIWRFALVLFLFLFSIRFINKNCTWLLLFCVVAFLGTFNTREQRDISAPIELLSLALFGVLFYVLDMFNFHIPFDLTSLVTLCLGAPLMYVAGKRLLCESENPTFDYKFMMWVMSIGMFAWPLISYLKNGVVTDYSPGVDSRLIADFWTGATSQVTNYNGYCVPALVMSLCTIVFSVSIKSKFIALVPFLGTLYLSFCTASRTNLFLLAGSLVGLLFVTAIIRKGVSPFLTKRFLSRVSIIILIAAVSMPIVGMAFNDLFAILPLDAFRERTANRSLSFSNDSRWIFWQMVIRDIPSHPFGGIHSVKAAHNLLLDIACVGGVIPMLLMFVFLLSVLAASIELALQKTLPLDIRVQNILLVVVLMLSFMTEPTLSAKPFVFIAFCFICGMQRGLLVGCRSVLDGGERHDISSS